MVTLRLGDEYFTRSGYIVKIVDVQYVSGVKVYWCNNGIAYDGAGVAYSEKNDLDIISEVM